MSRTRKRAALLLLAGFPIAAASVFGAGTASEAAETAGEERPPAEVRVLRTGGLRVESAALLWSGQQGGPVAIAARAFAMPGKNPASPDKVNLALVVEAVGGRLAQAAEEGDFPTLPVDVAIYALDSRGALAASLLETVEIPDAGETLRTKGLRFVGGFGLRPGSYSLRILVGHAGSKAIGLLAVPLTIPAIAEPARSMPGTSAGGLGGRDWLTVFSLDADALGLTSFWLSEQAGLAVDLLPPGDPAQNENGREAGAAAATGGLAEEAGDALASDAPGRWRRSEAKALRATYSRILARLGTGDEKAALAEVAAFEVPLLSGPNAATREELTGLEGVVLRALEKRDPQSLLPLMALYRTLHGTYQLRRLSQPAMHAVILVGSLAELYARAVPTPEGRRLAAGFLVSLTPNLDRSGLSSLIETEFARALEIDPEQPEALLGAAQSDERHGRYAEAAGKLARLLAQNPDDLEASVRLAINNARIGQTKHARELFLQIVAPLREPPPPSSSADENDWLLALAAQELARLEIAAKDRAAAGRAVAIGLARFPGDEKLLLLRAALAELQSSTTAEAAAAKEQLAQWAPRTTGEDSPRLRYGELPRRRIDALWLTLKGAAEDRLAALAAALGLPATPATPKDRP